MVKTITEYISAQPKENAKRLTVIRKELKKIIPKGEEVISYGIPCIKLSGKYVIYFAGWKKHISLYPLVQGTAEKFKKELMKYERSKGTVKFPLAKPLPMPLIRKIAKFRMAVTKAAIKAKSK